MALYKTHRPNPAGMPMSAKGKAVPSSSQRLGIAACFGTSPADKSIVYPEGGAGILDVSGVNPGILLTASDFEFNAIQPSDLAEGCAIASRHFSPNHTLIGDFYYFAILL
jgi:hypothetical protein